MMSQSELERFRGHLEFHLGEVVRVHTDPLREDPRIHILEFGPSEGRDFITLVTYGISYRNMVIPKSAGVFGGMPLYIELVLTLPSNWSLSRDYLNDPKKTWPLDLLTRLGHYAHARHKWLAWGHVISNGDPPRPFSAETELCGCTLLDSLNLPEGFSYCDISQGKLVHLLSVIPLHAAEINLIENRGVIEFLPLIREVPDKEVLSLFSPNLCDKNATAYKDTAYAHRLAKLG